MTKMLQMVVWCFVLLLPRLGSSDDAREPWRYVVPPPGDRHESAPPRVVMLGETSPTDIDEQVDYRGTVRRYGQIRYGTENSTRVAVVADRLESGAVDVYLDTNRNRVIESSERLTDQGPQWRVPLAAQRIEASDEPTEYIERTVLLRLSRSGRTLTFATAGYQAGNLKVADSRLPARRFDANANGRFADPDDRLWIDLNADAKWNPFGEQFTCNPIIKLGDRRYAVRTDPAGDRFALEPLTGTGTIRLAVTPRDARSQVTGLRVLLVGRDGSAVGLREAAAITVPVNEYRVSSLSLVLSDPGGGESWYYVFSRASRSQAKWRKLEANDSLLIEPLASLTMRKDALDGRTSCRPGDTLVATPRVTTEGGLGITTCWRGKRSDPSMEGAGATITLTGPDGAVLARGRSEFS